MSPNAKVQAVVDAIRDGHVYAQAIAAHTGIKDRTVYGLLAQLEAGGWVVSAIEAKAVADAGRRPQRRMYELTPAFEALGLVS